MIINLRLIIIKNQKKKIICFYCMKQHFAQQRYSMAIPPSYPLSLTNKKTYSISTYHMQSLIENSYKFNVCYVYPHNIENRLMLTLQENGININIHIAKYVFQIKVSSQPLYFLHIL